MPTQTNVYFCWTPGQIVQEISKWANQMVADETSGIPWSVELDTYEGYRAVTYGREIGVPDTVVYEVFVLVTLFEDETAPARWFAESPGFQATVTQRSVSTTFPDPYLIFVWSVLAGALIADILEMWSNGALMVDESPLETDVVTGQLQSWTRVLVFDVLSEQLVIQTQWAVWNQEQITPYPDSLNVISFARADAATPAVSAGGGEAALQRIANALTDLAMQDIDISLNNGRSLFSVRSKVITGT